MRQILVSVPALLSALRSSYATMQVHARKFVGDEAIQFGIEEMP